MEEELIYSKFLQRRKQLSGCGIIPPQVRGALIRTGAAATLAALVAACTTVAPAPRPPTQPPTTRPGPSATAAPPASLNASGPAGLDLTFADHGRSIVDMGGTDDHANAMVVKSDGRVIVAGEARKDEQSLVTFALAGFNADDTPDTTFGTNGKVFTPFDEYNSSGALAAELQADGKLVVAGYAANQQAHHDTFAVARYNADGTLDQTFGTNGLVLTAIDQETGAGPEDRANAVAIDAQNRIVVAGETGSFMHDMAVSRYLPNGSLDTSFGSGGIVVVDLGGDDRAQSVVVEPSGAILVGGSGWINSGAEDFAAVRLKDDGSLDASFGIGGKAVTDFRGGDDTGQQLLLRPDGRFVLVGTIQLSGGCSPNPCERYGFGAASYTSSGALETTFGDNGKIEPDFIVSSGAYGGVRLADGVFAMGGHIGNEDFGLAFMTDHGSPINFADGSQAQRIDFASGSDRAFAVAAGPNNTVYLAGDATITDGGFDFALARFSTPTPAS